MTMSQPKVRRNKKKPSSRSRQSSPPDISLHWDDSPSPVMDAAQWCPQPESEAGPSSEPIELPPSSFPAPNARGFSGREDFIAFDFDDEEKEEEKPVRDWDRGKRRNEWDEPGRGPRRPQDGRDGRSYRDREGERDRKGKGKAKTVPWAKYVDWDSCRNAAELLHKEVEGYVRYISPTDFEHEARTMIVQLIARGIKTSYPDAEVLPFGSFGTKLYLPDGDIDLVVMSQSLAYAEKLSALRSLANIVKRTGVTDKVTIISKAKVPIVKFTTLYGRFAVDISMNQSNGVATCKMINDYLKKFPALRAIVLIIKAFLNQRSMNEVYSGGLGSYSIVCLAVSFLQMHPKIQRMEIDPSRNLGVLVVEFFELYGKNFNYNETGISLVFAGSYFNKDKRGWKDYGKPHLLSIEDPGDTSNDISRGTFGIKSVRQTFAGAYEILVSSLYERAQRLSARQDRSRRVNLKRADDVKDLFDPDDPDAMSVLSSIVSVTQSTINHRRIVYDVYKEGHLARMLGLNVPNGAMKSPDEERPRRNSKEDRKRKADSVTAAWSKADRVFSSDEETGHKRKAQTLSDESESRYQVSHRRTNGSPNKRMRTAFKQDVHQAPHVTEFISSDDDDDEEEGEIVEKPKAERKSLGERLQLNLVSDDGLDEIENNYNDKLHHNGRSNWARNGRDGETDSKSKQRRAFWASKGIAPADSDSD